MSKIPLYTQTTHDWHCNKNQPNKPYAVDLNVGTNEYIFGRVTPDNKFIVTTGLVKDPKPYGIKMVGGKKKKNGGGVSGFSKTDLSVYNENNYRNNELIYNALNKINKLNGLNSPCKNSMIDAQNNISGGAKKKNVKKTVKKPSTKKPVTKKPATKKPTTKKPATKKLATKKPATKKPATKKPFTKKPATKKSTTKKSPTKKTKKVVKK